MMTIVYWENQLFQLQLVDTWTSIVLNGFFILYFDNFYQPTGLVFLMNNNWRRVQLKLLQTNKQLHIFILITDICTDTISFRYIEFMENKGSLEQ
jgi:hypothetical protein